MGLLRRKQAQVRQTGKGTVIEKRLPLNGQADAGERRGYVQALQHQPHFHRGAEDHGLFRIFPGADGKVAAEQMVHGCAAVGGKEQVLCAAFQNQGVFRTGPQGKRGQQQAQNQNTDLSAHIPSLHAFVLPPAYHVSSAEFAGSGENEKIPPRSRKMNRKMHIFILKGNNSGFA